MADLSPFVLFESRKQPGLFGLELAEDAMVDVMDVFDDHAQYGNGFGWDAVAKQALRSAGLEGRVQTRPDADRWRAASRDRAALEELGRRLAAAYHDRDRLSELISGADPRWFT